MTGRTVPAVATLGYLMLAFLLLLHVVPSVCKVGEKCDITELKDDCSVNEKCVQVNKTSSTGVCACLLEFVEDVTTGNCEKSKPPPEPSGNHMGLALGLGLTVFLVVAAAATFTLHRKFGLLSGLCRCLPSPRLLFGIRSGDIGMVDDQDDDVNPIV